MCAQSYEQAVALAQATPDAILIETRTDSADARCALRACKSACDLPVIVSCTFGENGRMDLSGTDPATAAIILEACGADAVGMNCGLGPDNMFPLLEAMAQATSLPLIAQPNAGMPQLDAQGNTVYPGTPDQMAYWAERYRSIGVQIIGSCCGSTPAFTAAINLVVADRDVIPRTVERRGVVLAGPRGSVCIDGSEGAKMVGERINPTGKRALAQELLDGSLNMVHSYASSQIEAGADLLDVNVGAAGVYEPVMLRKAVNALVASYSLPLSLDSSDPAALEQALKAYPGRALINSANGDPKSYQKVFPLAKRYGAAVVLLALDENGIPKTAQGRVEIISRLRRIAAVYGLSDDDLLVDVLTMAAATDPAAPQVTLDAVRAIHDLGLHVILGASNVSHGLPDRMALNRAFITACIINGADALIANPNDAQLVALIHSVMPSSNPKVLAQAWNGWQQAYQAALDKAAAGLGNLASGSGAAAAPAKSAAPAAPAAPSDPAKALRNAVLQGNIDAAASMVDAVLAVGTSPEAIIPDILAPAIQDLGDAYGRGEVFLPQLMSSGEAMKAAVARVKSFLPPVASKGLGKVLFCTVKGDIHSIGKDICISLLESQGFEVLDLGVDVEPQRVVQEAAESGAQVVCLSALMTTTLPAMRETVFALQKALPQVKVMVGGAVVTKQWADTINALYSKDAPGCVRKVREILEEGKVE
ncbi:MAG: homocysteine S-methyltransferase family protein [Coriobacteriales bacterium]|nr:homocysteine S-methyltransferase family protein [Coriobacteriales bacterium]